MTRHLRSAAALCLLVICALPIFPAPASETIAYGYDARGRLVQVNRSGSVSGDIQASYSYDKGDNRTNVTVTGPGFSVNDVAATEGSALVFTVTRSGGISATHSVSYATSDGTAAVGSDYSSASGTLTFGVGVATQTVSVSTIDDGSVEANETLTLTLSNAIGATITDGQGIGTITNNDEVPPSFAIGDLTVNEANTAVITVTKSGSTSLGYSVNYATTDGSAIAGINYSATSGTLAFAPGEASKTISVTTLNDGQIRPNRSFAVNLSAPTGGAVLADSSATVSIVEIGEIILLAGQSMWSSDGRFQLIMQTDGNLVLYGPDGFMWATGTNGGSDRRMVMQGDGNLVVYNSANQALWHSGTYGNPGARLVLQNDGNLVIYSASNAFLWHTNTPYVPPAFAIGDASITEGGGLAFTVTRSKPTTATYGVNFTTANGTAVGGSDYYAGSGSITFAPSETTKSITIGTIDDTSIEGAETLYVNLSGATGGATIGDGQGIGTINDNDVAPPPSFSINDASGIEGGSMVFTVTKTGSTSSSFSVNFATAGGTANAFDYVDASGTLTFGPTETSKTITVTTRDDSDSEWVENFYVNLSGATGGATITDSQGTGQIEDNGDTGGCEFCLVGDQPPPEDSAQSSGGGG